MLLPFLLCVMVLYASPPLIETAAGWPSAAGVGVLALLNAGAAWAGTWLAIRLSRAPHAGTRLAGVRILSMLKGLVVGFVVADAFVMRWPGCVQSLFASHPWAVLGDDLLLLLPALVMIVTVMAFWHRYETSLGSLSLPLGRYLWLRFRVELAVILVPWLLLVLATDVTDALLRASPHLALIDAAVSVAALLVMVIFSPLLLRVIWSSTPLPDGELRRRLEGLCRRHNFHCRDILVWHTYNHLGNAGVMGPMPFLRYVVLTDALLERCTESEVEAIFAHEIGHVRHHHLPFYMLFALAFGGLYVNLIDLLEPTGWVEPLQKLLSFEMTPSQAAVMLGFAIVYWVLVFGFVSRRMEQQADLFALCATGDPGAFLSALAKLSLMSGTPRRIPFWRHFSIERRLRFLTDVIETPALAAAFRARVFAMQGALVLIFAAALVRLALLGPSLLGA